MRVDAQVGVWITEFSSNLYVMDNSTPLDVATGTIVSCTFVFVVLRDTHIVLTSVLSTAITGALITGTYALATRRGKVVAGIYAASTALNCGIAGATFLSTLIVFFTPVSVSPSVGIRGYAIVPLLDQTLSSRLLAQESAQRGSVSPEVSTNGAVTWGTMRLHRVLDSALSGGITGSILNTLRRSSLPIPPYLGSG